jgi:hypothetical protein
MYYFAIDLYSGSRYVSHFKLSMILCTRGSRGPGLGKNGTPWDLMGRNRGGRGTPSDDRDIGSSVNRNSSTADEAVMPTLSAGCIFNPSAGG